MNLIMPSFINECIKLWSHKKTVFFLAVTVLLPLLGLPLVMKLQSGFGITAIASSDYALSMLNIFTVFILPLMIFMSVSDSFSGEFGDKTIRAVLVRPVDRFKIFASKLLAVFALICAGLALGFVSSAVASLFLEGSAGYASALAESALSYAAAAFPMFALTTAAVFVAQFFKNASGALAVCILIYAAAKLIGFIFPDVSAFLPTAYADWHQLWIGSVVSLGKIATVFSFLLGFGIVFSTSGYYVFDRKEV